MVTRVLSWLTSGICKTASMPIRTATGVLLRQVIDLLDLLERRGKVEFEVLEQAVLETKDPAVDDGELAGAEALLDDGHLHDVPALLDDVELDQAVVAGLLVGDGVELLLVEAVDVADVAQPGVQDAQVLGGHGGLDAAAAVVATDDNVFDAQVLDGIVHDRGGVEVDAADQVGDVAVHKDLAGFETGDLLGGDPAVRTADPQVLGGLAGR